jgi:peptidoglycan/LPS O-acetylase OafA/YrhL
VNIIAQTGDLSRSADWSAQPYAGDPERLPEINGLRGIAILMVLFCHLWEYLFYNNDNSLVTWNEGQASILWWMATVLRQSWTGVNVFFVLSGFVLVRPYVIGTRRLETRKDVVDFYSRRAWRLIPLLSISTVIFVALSYPNIGGWQCLKQLCLTMTGFFVFTKQFYFPPVNVVLWSLGVEIWFSVFFPVVGFFLLRRKPLFWVVAFYFFALLVRIVGAGIHFADLDNPHINPVKDSIFGRIDDFVAGMGACLIYYRSAQKSWFGSALMGLAGAGSVMVGFMSLDLASLHLLPHLTVAISNIPISLGVTLLLLYALFSPSSLWAWLLRFETLQVCGVMCYSIYVWHYNILHHLVSDRLDYRQVVIYLGLLFLVASVSWLLIENANRKDIRSRLHGLTACR